MEEKTRLAEALADRYRIEREIGSGGMATVYLAHDLKHDRNVAVKVLRPELAAVMGKERFLAEIRTTANLSHPHILPLHDSGEADGFLFYVMPLVEGESLRQKLDRDGQLPVEEAVRIAGHVADALAYAHQQGVVHRDIKPGNILFQAGDPVVTDFGIALAVSAAGEGRLTETGLSLGTPYYMSPEQATGDQAPTAASDVYSLGCVLYEMLTGDPPHTGSSAQAVLGKILLGEVTAPTKLRRSIPANVEGTLLKALERLPADRFESVGQMAAALRDKTFRHGVGVEAGVLDRSWKGLAIGSTALALLALVAFVTVVLTPGPSPPPTLKQPILPPGDGVVTDWARHVALAPDGASMVYRDTVGLPSGWELWIKERGSTEGRRLPGTRNARDVAFSPDGRSIVYSVGTDLIKRSVTGGGADTLLTGLGGLPWGVDWLADGSILAEHNFGTLVRIPVDVGLPLDTLAVFGPDDFDWVNGLPGERAALVVRCIYGYCVGGSELHLVDFGADTTEMLLEGVLRAWYVPTGHVIWVSREGEVYATPFDLDRLKMSDTHTRLFGDVRHTTSRVDMVLGKDGTVLYLESPGSGASQEGDAVVKEGVVVWVDRTGGIEQVDPGWGSAPFSGLALSPDGQRVAVSIEEGATSQVWVKDLLDGTETLLTTGEGLARRPKWSPDGATIAYAASEGLFYGIRTVPSDGRSVGSYETPIRLDRSVSEVVYTPDGQGLVFGVGGVNTGTADIGFIDLATGETNETLLATGYNEFGAALSPDGRWLAYTSDSSGEDEVYVRPFPDVNSGFTKVSQGGGTEPVWSHEGQNELFYRGADGRLWAVTYTAETEFEVESWEALFDARPYSANRVGLTYTVAPSGDRFLMVQPVSSGEDSGAEAEPRLIQILNWFTELEERLGEGGS